jgi:hypothetical protein
VLAHNHQNTEVCVAAGKEIASRATALQLGAMLGVGRCGGIENTSLVLLTSEERRTRPHMASALRCSDKRPKPRGRPDASFNDLVGAGEHRWRHGEAECLGGPQIEHQFECGWLLDE